MAATQLPASAVASKLPSGQENREYEKILRISEDIFSGTHPRLKVPQQFVRKAVSRNPPVSLTPQNKADEKAVLPPKGPSRSAAPVSKPTSSHSSVTANGPSSTTASARILPKPASEIDPIFLEKSDDLVRAELQLQRQRVERELREQLELKRQESKQKVSIQDATPDFDVSDVLARAFELVKPSPSLEGPGPAAPSDSFDENSFYSSRAPDSPQHGDRYHKRSSASSSNPEEQGAEATQGRYSDELQRLEALNRPDSDQSMQDTYSIADHRTSHNRQPHRPEDTSAYRAQPVRQQVDPIEEPEYSPPAPGVAPMERVEVESYEPQRGYPQGPRRRALDREDRYARRSESPPHRVRLIRNHITSPAAPQPSRVSPLAIAKAPSVNQHHASRPEYEPERHGSPEVVATQPVISRKRRRLQDDKDRGYRQGVGSVKPFIKEEPVSPPPFADTPPMYRARAPQEGPVYIDVSSPRYTPVVERREPQPPLRTSAYELEPYDETHGDSGIQRTVSRLSTRRPMRDDQDLRRVASLHQARKPEYVREYMDQGSPHPSRGPYTIVERLPPENTRYYEEPGAPPPRRFASPLPPQMAETYYNDYVVAPPPRRIVIDEHGNEYYEALPAPRVQAMPPPSSRIPRSDVYEGPPQIRQASMRATSVVEDPYGGRRYVQEVPSQGAYRRVTDYARPTPSERRPYPAPFGVQEPYPRSSSVQVHDYAGRQGHYVEEMELPRERIVRVPSVRPPTTTRYQEPREVIQRVESVHPGGRDMSVYMDEETRHPREYIERPPVYVATRPVAREERYYDNGEPDRIVQLDGPRDGAHRAPQRY